MSTESSKSKGPSKNPRRESIVERDLRIKNAANPSGLLLDTSYSDIRIATRMPAVRVASVFFIFVILHDC